MTERTRKRLIIDLARCDQCHGADHPCKVDCGYYDRAEGVHGMLALRERATFELICRRCVHASCIIACPFDALERADDGIIKRHNLRCVSCKSCAIACPFGTIYMELLPYYAMSYETSCGSCLADLDAQAPDCASSCPEGALEFREVDPSETDVYMVDDKLAARVSSKARAWNRIEPGAEAGT